MIQLKRYENSRLRNAAFLFRTLLGVCGESETLGSISHSWKVKIPTLIDAGPIRIPQASDRQWQFVGILVGIARPGRTQVRLAPAGSGAARRQRLLDRARWDADAARDDLVDYVIEELGNAGKAQLAVAPQSV